MPVLMSPNQPRVSIVLPVYNGVPYLRESISSVLAQTMPNWELIIWDDGSKDQSGVVISEFATDPRIRVFSHSCNQGLFETLNAAISVARGPLIRLWSQDDVMKPECLEAEMAFNDKHPCIAMSYCQYDVIDDQGTLVIPAKEDRTPELVEPLAANQIMFHHGSLTGNIANVTLRRSTLEELGLFRTDMRVAGDFEMWVRIARRHTIGFLRRSLLYLRSHTAQFSRRPGINPTFICETRPLYQELMQRLPPQAREYAKRYYRRHHLRLYAHDMVRTLALGKIRLARQVFLEIAKVSSPWRILAILIVTMDGHLFRPVPRYFDVELDLK
jgi:glycosyltransferase involved in cell wall biosynthesis